MFIHVFAHIYIYIYIYIDGLSPIFTLTESDAAGSFEESQSD